MSEFEIREIDGKYCLYCADEEVLSPEGESISTTSEELANLLLKDAEEYGVDCENPLSILSYHALYCDLLQQEEDPTFSIYADETVPIKEVVQVMNIAKRNHYKVIMATSPE